MGIKSINKLLKEQAPDAFFTLGIDTFSGKRIAVDANNWMYTMMYKTNALHYRSMDTIVMMNKKESIKKWVECAIEFIVTLMINKVTPVFVFDGTSLPEKEKEQARRREDRLKRKEKLKDLLDKQDKLVSVHELKSAVINNNDIGSEDIEYMINILECLGIPCIVAKADAEKLCSMMCREGIVAAVYSTDTDNYVYGCPLLITGRSKERKNGYIAYDCVRYDRIVESLELSHEQFVDLCIMCGCDYNKNIKGIGPSKSLTLIRNHGLIHKLPKNYDTKELLYVKCRNIFKTESSDIDDDLEVVVLEESEIDQLIEKYDLKVNKKQIMMAYEGSRECDSGSIEELELGMNDDYSGRCEFAFCDE